MSSLVEVYLQTKCAFDVVGINHSSREPEIHAFDSTSEPGCGLADSLEQLTISSDGNKNFPARL